MQRSNPEIDKLYHSARWKRLKRYKKQLNPFCEECLKNGIYTPTYIIHHKTFINQSNYKDENVFFNLDNLESVCLDCHNKIHFKGAEDYMFTSDGDVIKKENKKNKKY